MQKEAELPIDIHTNKLLDWLISRRQCNHDWQNTVKVVRQKINIAIQDMPAMEEITQMLTGTYINYFHCLRLVELLKDTESGKKNLFGQYSSKRMKDWLEIVKLYEKDNVGLAEAAQLLIRNVSYEITSLKKQIAKCQHSQEDCQRREADYIKNSNDCKDKYFASCKQLGIEGNNIRSELLSLLSTLPTMYENYIKLIKNLSDSCCYYNEFKEFSLGRESKCLPLIHYLISNGNTTLFEYETGRKPLKVEEPVHQLAIEIEKAANEARSVDAIDFGGDDEGIDFGIELASVSEGIDFGDNETSSFDEINVAEVDSDSNANHLDWEIVVETNGDTADVIDANSNVARGEKALTLLDNRETRNAIVDELYELKAFLAQRLQEMQSEGDVLSSSQFQTAPLTLQLQTTNCVLSMLHIVEEILTGLTNVQMQNLQLVRDSPRYVDRLVDSLTQKRDLIDKMLQSAAAVASLQKQMYEEQNMLEPKLDLIILKTKELKGQIEKEISKHYKNRPVNIMGEINTL